MNSLFLVLGHFSHYSDILRSKLIGELKKKYKIFVFTEHINDKVAKKEGFPVDENIKYIKVSPKNPRLWKLFDAYLRLAFIREFDDWRVTKEWYYKKTHPLKTRFLISLGKIFLKKFPRADFFSTLESILMREPNEFCKVAKIEKPLLLISGTPGYSPLEAELILSAKKMGIKTCAIDINYDNAYSKAKFVRKTNYISVWNGKMKKEVVNSHHYTQKKIKTVGCLRFDHYFTDPSEHILKTKIEFLKSKNMDSTKKLIIFIGPSPIMYPPREEFISSLIRLKINKLLEGDANILIRLHPHDVWSTYEKYFHIDGVRFERAGKQRVPDKKTKGQKIEMDKKDLLNLTETLTHADVVIQFVSTMIIEACIFDKPVISVGYPKKMMGVNNWEFNKALIDAGRLTIVKNPDELRVAINEYILHPEKNRKNRQNIIKNYVQFTDGKAWKRTLDFLEEII